MVSSMSEPRRYYIDSCRDDRGFMRATDCLQSHEDSLRANSIEVMPVEDHDRIVAELRVTISQLKENETKLKAEFERLKHFYQVPIRYPIEKGK